MSTESILLLGASGQVGGALLTVLRSQYPSYPITLFLRTHALDAAIGRLSKVTVVHGDFETSDGLASLENTVSKHGIIINAATSRDITVNQAVLRGLEKYRATTKQNAILIHVSGAGNFSDNREAGEFHTTGEVAGLQLPFDDTDPTAVSQINAHHQPNGASDEIIMAFTRKGKANAYIVCPGGIYGASQDHIGILSTTDEGRKYARTPGVWAGWMIENIKQLGFSPYVGQGKSYFYTVHVDDVVSLILLVFAKAMRERVEGTYAPEDVYGNFYIAAGDGYIGSDIADLFAKAVAKLGIIKENAVVKSVTYEEAGLTARYLAGNILLKGKNAQKLGWKRKGKSLEETLLE
jgi:nucleoside-diphosphate-sugar epimerase